jgi:tartrate-resistant acid phosphatase type 5
VTHFHLEEYVYLAGLTHKTALIAWGGFFFKVKDDGDFKLVDDDDLKHVFPPRKDTIGASSRSYGPAHVIVRDADGNVVAKVTTTTTNHVEVTNLLPDTEYTYEVFVSEKPWAQGELRDWQVNPDGKGGLKVSAASYDNRFRTFPHVTLSAPVAFAVIGDFGSGVKKPSKESSRQREIAKALELAVDQNRVAFLVTTGDNIYASKKIGPIAVGGQGDEDDDWFFTYYQPYRYVINRIPVFPSVGNHDSGEAEFENDDRTQIMDNFYIRERFGAEEMAGRASLKPGLFYRFRFGADVELIALDTSKATIISGSRFFQDPAHVPFLKAAFTAPQMGVPLWRLPFFHHPPYTAGPGHHNSTSVIEGLVDTYFKPAHVTAVFCGHEHNFQLCEKDAIRSFVTGGAGKVSVKPPDKDRFATAFVKAWAGEAHFLLVAINGLEMKVLPLGEIRDGKLTAITLMTGDDKEVPTPIAITL